MTWKQWRCEESALDESWRCNAVHHAPEVRIDTLRLREVHPIRALLDHKAGSEPVWCGRQPAHPQVRIALFQFFDDCFDGWHNAMAFVQNHPGELARHLLCHALKAGICGKDHKAGKVFCNAGAVDAVGHTARFKLAGVLCHEFG